MLPDAEVKHLELSAAYTRHHVTHPVVITYLAVLVVRRRIPGLGGEETGTLNKRSIIRYQRPAAAGGDDLVTVERQNPELAVASDPPAHIF